MKKLTLKVDRLFIKSPVNMKCLLSQNERDFLEAVIHLQSMGKIRISDVMIMANSGLNDRQITRAKRNLAALGLLSVESDSRRLGSIYSIDSDKYNRHLDLLNSIRVAPMRFEAGDTIRTECGLQSIFTNIIHRLQRSQNDDAQTNDCDGVKSAEEQKQALQTKFDNKEITIEEYREYLKRIDL